MAPIAVTVEAGQPHGAARMTTRHDIGSLDAPTGDDLAVEIVERKGLGHPDSICDALCEELSLELSRRYRVRTGRILHHNVDKALLWGGAATPAFGGGEVREPMEIFLAGRAITRFGGEELPIAELAVEATKRWFRTQLPTVDVERQLKVHSLVRAGAVDLVELYERQARAGAALANDTSIGVGYAPFSRLETAVYRIERRLNDPAVKAAHPAIGADIKVMGVRRGPQTHLTVACAFIGRHLRDLDDYLRHKAVVAALARDEAQAAGIDDPVIDVNTADDPVAGSIYLTVTGTSAEAGDDGQAGRGNRVNGLIVPFRPMTMESVAGKNPVTHVGKLYNLVAGLMAQDIVEQVPGVAEAQVFLVSQIGVAIDRPQVCNVRIKPAPGATLDRLRPRIAEVADAGLSGIGTLADALIDGEVRLDRWPLRDREAAMTPELRARRDALLAEIRSDAAMTGAETGRHEFAPRVIRSLAEVRREDFVPANERDYAYDNIPLPIGMGQTISQPFIVALMTELLDLKGDETVLEIGTGSGYQAAVLARLARSVYSVEVVEPLANEARARLRRLGYGNVEIRHGDGWQGWPEHAPYDAIIVTAAAAEMPKALVAQLKPGGRMVIPVGESGWGQNLVLVTKDAAGHVRERAVLPVAFVPMVHG